MRAPWVAFDVGYTAALALSRPTACVHSQAYNNQFNGAIPDSFGSLASLIDLCVRCCFRFRA